MKRKVAEKNCDLLSKADDANGASEDEETYEEKVRDLKQQLKFLTEKTHPEYLKVKRKLDNWLAEEKQRVHILHEHRLETISREYTKESEACDRDCELEKRRIQDYLISLCEELKRRLEHDKKNIELTPSGDILDFKPAITRKLRRRAGSDLPSASSTGFFYWGDLLLCGAPWALNVAGSKATQCDGNIANELLSPIPNSGTETNQENIANTLPEIDCFESSKPTRGSPTSTTESNSSRKIKTGYAKSNLFGSLGINLFDGTLLSHLLASMNNSGANNSSPFGLCNGSNGAFSGTAAAAAVATGLMMPSSLTNNNSLAALLNSVAGNLIGQPTSKKRRQQNSAPVAQLNLLLPENDIYADLTVIHRACAKAATSGLTSGTTAGGVRKHSQQVNIPSGQQACAADSPPHSGTRADPGSNSHTSGQSKNLKESDIPTLSSPGSGCAGSPSPQSTDITSNRIHCALSGSSAVGSAGLSVWIDDGRLYCGQKCFQNGALVILEGRDGSSHRCTGTIVAIGAQDVMIRRNSDHGICRVTVQQLKQGRYALWPAVSP